MIITVDDREPIEKIFFFQKGPRKKLTVEISELSLVDNIKIEAYSSKGGFLEKEFSMQEFKE